MTEATLKTFIEAPKSVNLVTFIKQRCVTYNIFGKIKSEPLNRDWVDKLCGINRETVYLDLKGDEQSLTNLIQELIQLAE